jgi:ATP phosphoribosyltransferase involved in histidine biosynthesis
MRYYSGSEARFRRATENVMISIFDGWSYEEITTPTIDYYSLFEHGMGRAQVHHAFRLSDTDGRMLAVRPDVTSLVARAAATLFAERERPLRLCYVAPGISANNLNLMLMEERVHPNWRRADRRKQRVSGYGNPAIICEVLQRLNLDARALITLNESRSSTESRNS